MFEDPNWLMSSTAQSAAAVVAIVAGFITTRILSLTSERRALRANMSQREERMRFLNERRDELNEKRRRLVVYSAFEPIRKRLMEEADDPTIDEVMAETKGAGIPEDLLKQEYTRLIAQRDFVANFVNENARTIDLKDPDVVRWVRRVNLDANTLEWEFIDHYFNKKRDELLELQPRRAWLTTIAADLNFGPVYAPPPDPEREIDRELSEISIERRFLDRELASLQATLQTLVMPRTIWIALAILSYIAITSVIFPLALLPASSEESWMTPTIVGMFALGLGALLAYIALELRLAARHR